MNKKKKLKKIKKQKIMYMLNCLLGRSHNKWIKKNDIFAYFGENVIYQPYKLPNDPKLIKIHDNVKIANNVTFYEHDIINFVFQKMENDKIKYNSHLTCIEIFDNVFIGGNSTIIGNCKIGPNAIVAGGSVVTKDVPEGTIVAGNPAKIIGNFYDLKEKRKKDRINYTNIDYKKLWSEFYNK